MKVSPSSLTFTAGAQEVFTFKVGFTVPVNGSQTTDGQVTGDIPIQLLATVASNDTNYGGGSHSSPTHVKLSRFSQ